MRKNSLLLDRIRKKNIDKVALEVALEIVCQVKMEEGISGGKNGRSKESEVRELRKQGIGRYTI